MGKVETTVTILEKRPATVPKMQWWEISQTLQILKCFLKERVKKIIKIL